MDVAGTQRTGILHLATAALVLLLLWLPLPSGSVQPVGHWILRWTAAVVLLATALARKGPISRSARWGAVALTVIAAEGLLQVVPWPASLAGLVSPAHLLLASSAREVVRAPDVTRVALTLAPSVTLSVALTWAALGACVAGAWAVGHDRARRRILGAALLAAALAQVLLGTRLRVGGTVESAAVEDAAGRLRGTFVNPDHLALYLEIGLAAAFALAWWGVRRAARERDLERKLLLVSLPILAWLVLFVGLAFTGSRAGLVAAVAGACGQGLLVAASSRHWRPGTLAIAIVALGLMAVTAIGLEQGFGRWLSTSRYELTWNDRLSTAGATWELWQRFPILGCGLGTFRDGFPLVQHAASGTTPWHAHNDWLELLATAGLVGALAFAAGLAAVARGLLRRVDASLRSEDRAAALAALGALLAVGLHSLFDFGLTMPASAATLAVLCGGALAVPAPVVGREPAAPPGEAGPEPAARAGG